MKLITFKTQNAHTSIGLYLNNSQILNLTDASRSLRPQFHTASMLQWIEWGDEALNWAEKLEATALTQPAELKSFILPESQIEILAPLPKPVSLRDGYAFRQHVETSRRNRGVPMVPEFDQFPVFYYGNALTISGPGAVYVDGAALNRLDFELEAGIILGKKGINVKANEADSMIYGYVTLNDWSARAIWMDEESKLSLGPAKAKDFATTIGPFLIPRRSLKHKRIEGPAGERFDLSMKAFINGRQYSEGNLKDMSWTFAQIIERASAGVMLYPGELIGSGTVGTGCLFELNGSKVTDNLWLKPGDEVTLEIEELGTLKNKIIQGSPQ